jgi:SAM-dependent methyltransferase
MSDSGYQNLADIYDLLQRDLDLQVWASYIELADQSYSRRQTGQGKEGRPILLDLGCGTGEFCLEMAGRGYDPIGIDSSAAMLDRARSKDPDGNCLFIQQDISRFELFGTVDLAVCLLDTINHLIQPAKVASLFRLCANYLNPGCLFIFDLASYRYFARTFGQQCYFQDFPDFTLLWQNHFRKSSGVSSAELVLFRKSQLAASYGKTAAVDNAGAAGGERDLYEKSETTIRERYWSTRQIACWVKDAGLELVARSGAGRRAKAADTGQGLIPPAKAGEREFFIVRKCPIQDGMALAGKSR